MDPFSVSPMEKIMNTMIRDSDGENNGYDDTRFILAYISIATFIIMLLYSFVLGEMNNVRTWREG